VDIRVLGPVEILADARRLDLGHARQRAVLAVLVVELNQVVPAEWLIDRVWGEEPPGSARNLIHGYVGKLKMALARAGEPGVSLSRQPGGYVLGADSDLVDLFRFRRLVGEAARADGRVTAGMLQAALALWSGDAFTGLTSQWLDAIRHALATQRLTALLDLNDLALVQGQHQSITADLMQAASAHPADERLTGQLMLALYRSGRQAEALRWYELTRRTLADELGVSPGSELQALHLRILRSDPSLSQLKGDTKASAMHGRERRGPRPACQRSRTRHRDRG
jgi:DNA-binding SARP family transcriptional activator